MAWTVVLASLEMLLISTNGSESLTLKRLGGGINRGLFGKSSARVDILHQTLVTVRVSCGDGNPKLPVF